MRKNTYGDTIIVYSTSPRFITTFYKARETEVSRDINTELKTLMAIG